MITPSSSQTAQVRQAQAPGRVFLREVDLALGAVHGAPLANAPLQRTQYGGVVVAGVATLQFLQQGNGVERAVRFEQGHDLTAPYRSQRVDAGAPRPRFALRG